MFKLNHKDKGTMSVVVVHIFTVNSVDALLSAFITDFSGHTQNFPKD